MDAFRRLGCSVVNLNQVGSGCPDVAVALHGITVMVEIKSEDGKLTPEQVRFHREWKGLIREARLIKHVEEIVSELKRKMREAIT